MILDTLRHVVHASCSNMTWSPVLLDNLADYIHSGQRPRSAVVVIDLCDQLVVELEFLYMRQTASGRWRVIGLD